MNFNFPKLKDIPSDQKKVFQLYNIFFKELPKDKDFLSVCQQITNHLIDLAGDTQLDQTTADLIKDVIHYLVHNLRNANEYGTDIDATKKQIILDLETVAKDFFETLHNRVDEHVSMEDIAMAWQQERLNKN